jgi:phage shock protein PspC (stress-responsive transcriptional regulator)
LLSIDDNAAIGFGKYYGLPVNPVQILGILVVVFAVMLCLLGVVAPQTFAAVIPLPTTQFINRRDTMEDTEDTTGRTSDVVDELDHMEEPVELEGDDGAIE